MSAVKQQRCFHHGFREAVAKCPTCAQFYCRECITEHHDRMICAGCLEKELIDKKKPRKSSQVLLRVGQLISGFLVIWIAFYFVGQVLLGTPTQLHEGTLWQEEWWWGE